MKRIVFAAAVILGMTTTGSAQTKTLEEGIIVEKIATTEFMVFESIDTNSWSYIVKDMNTGVSYEMVPTHVDLPIGAKAAYDLGRWGADGDFGRGTARTKSGNNGNCGTCGTKVFRILGKA